MQSVSVRCVRVRYGIGTVGSGLLVVEWGLVW